MRYTKEQFEKLPKWAQMEITVLQRNNESLSKTVNELLGKTETNTFISFGLEKKSLPNNSMIEFKTGINNTDTVGVRIMSDGIIDVNTDSRTGKSMVIMPRASNSFYITFTDIK